MGTSETYAAHLYNNYQYQQFISDINSDAVYHYTTSDTLFKIAEKKQLRFTNRLYLNDCSEGRYNLTMWNYYSKGDGINIQCFIFN